MVIVTEHTELNKTLIIAKGSGKEYSLARTDQNSLTLPSQPRIQLQHPSELLNYVREEQTVRDLDKAAGWLWLASILSTRLKPFTDSALDSSQPLTTATSPLCIIKQREGGAS